MEEDKSKDIKNEEKDEKSSDDDEKVEKSDFQETIKSNIDTLTDVIKSLAETQKDVSSTLSTIDDRLKALETPTDLPLKPQTSAAEDVGAKVTVPDTYQANSVQAGLDDDKHAEDKPESDPSGLKMQEKAEVIGLILLKYPQMPQKQKTLKNYLIVTIPGVLLEILI